MTRRTDVVVIGEVLRVESDRGAWHARAARQRHRRLVGVAVAPCRPPRRSRCAPRDR
ncbi:hypothetical protein ABZX75_02855 [Streptomyces sp. NPDC003038]|uniref:hypothetical protein n=1 Tax=unclassified Streptomyces TaxID=2593676 RepID=UPI0033A8E38C